MFVVEMNAGKWLKITACVNGKIPVEFHGRMAHCPTPEEILDKLEEKFAGYQYEREKL
jgi:hypothetical protein